MRALRFDAGERPFVRSPIHSSLLWLAGRRKKVRGVKTGRQVAARHCTATVISGGHQNALGAKRGGGGTVCLPASDSIRHWPWTHDPDASRRQSSSASPVVTAAAAAAAAVDVVLSVQRLRRSDARLVQAMFVVCARAMQSIDILVLGLGVILLPFPL